MKFDKLNMNEGFMKENDFQIKELTKDKCILVYKVKKTGLNPYGIIHGGIIFGLADSACGILSRNNGNLCVTTSANINYLNICKDKKIEAVATIIKSGKNIGYYRCDIFDEHGKIIANANVNLYYLDK